MVRRGVTLVVSVVLMVALGSCQTSAESSPTGGEAQDGYPRTIITQSTETTLEQRPESVVTLGNLAFENVVALGVEPVGSTVTSLDELPYLAEHADLPALATLTNASGAEINFEAIAALGPDLIVVPDWPNYTDEATLERLGQIAPTLAFDTLAVGTDRRTGMVQVGEALGLEAEAQKLVTDAEAAYAEITQDDQEITYSFGLAMDGQIMLGAGGYLLNLAGLTPTEDQLEVQETRQPITYSTELLGEVAGDVVLLLARTESDQAQITAAPAWQGNLERRTIWLSTAEGEAVNNAGILGKTWFAGELPSLLAAIG